MKILVSGSSGLIGSALIPILNRRGDQVIRLVRHSPKGAEIEIQWDPVAGILDTTRLEGLDAVVHLAGDPIASGRWTPEKKIKIRDSRVKGTKLLAESLARLQQPPKVLACASAIGIYGNRGEEILREESAPGAGFLAEVGQDWEKATAPAAQKGIRVVNTRFGIVMSTGGGALAMMMPPFRFGLGGKLGSGKQWMSWVAIDDVAGAIHHILVTDGIRGPVNVVSPHPVTNLEFTKTLGRVLRRPTLFFVPAFAARLAFGELADEALLASARVEPAKLLSSGYRFRYPELEGALRSILAS
ncbi:MAG: TIGR01777 family protein [Candidatus Omnitrophica bacterium]|nr:TIGR01777 family protein [Candidatus Omnitrophota bacterium]